MEDEATDDQKGGMPDIPLGKVVCPDCRGQRRYRVLCKTCRGAGFVDAVPDTETTGESGG